MIPPKTVSILDRHGGATAETTSARSSRLGPPATPDQIGDTLWVPGDRIKGTAGTLIEGSVNEKGFYQRNNNITSAKYKVPGYRYPIVTWWDNLTGERIA